MSAPVVAAPTFRVVREGERTRTGYSLDVEVRGGEIREDWRATARGEPWCRFSLFVTGSPSDHVLTSYGGEVWPSAWPRFFVGHGRELAGGIALTAEGQEAVRLAVVDFRAFGVRAVTQTPACDRCSEGVMDMTNSHRLGTCPCVCHRPAQTVSDLAHDRRDAEREDDDRFEEARDARARGED